MFGVVVVIAFIVAFNEIALIAGVACAIRRPKLRKLTITDYPDVDPERFGAWHSAQLKASNVLLWGAFGPFVISLASGFVLAGAGFTLPQIRTIGAVISIAGYVVVLLAVVYSRRARELGEAAGILDPAQLHVHQRLVGALISPGETFADVNRKPTWIAPLIIGTVTVIAGTAFFNWRVKPEWDQILRHQIVKRVESSGRSLTEEQIQQQVEIGKTFANYAPVFAAAGPPILYIILAGIFALGLMLIQAKATFEKILSVVVWSSAATGIVATVVTMASLMVRDEEGLRSIDPTQGAGIVPSNLAAFLSSETSAVIKSVAGSLDIFTIWLLILLTIGFAAIAGSRKITTGKTATVVFGFWAVYVLCKVGWAAAFGG